MYEEDLFYGSESPELSLRDDFTKWIDAKPEEKEIVISITVEVSRERDTGLYEFIKTHLSLNTEADELEFTVEVKHIEDRLSQHEVTVSIEGDLFDGLKAQEVLKKLQSSKTILFHNSTSPDRDYRYSRRALFRDFSEEYREQIERMNRSVERGLKKIAKEQQKELADLLGRLEASYKVGLSPLHFSFSYIPFDITLGDAKVDLALDEWGSGTRNRTLILMTLLRAKQISDAGASASKITPILVVEEPESFLHPSAQAEFGRVLQDLSQEFNVQVLVTSHSPYMLGMDAPESNILLERRKYKGQIRETKPASTSGENWMEPFVLALGISGAQFEPWKDIFFSPSESILLVEGDTDKEYFELLKSEEHGKNKLKFSGEIFSYNGRDNLKNGTLLRFVVNRHKQVLVTYDLDAEGEVEPTLKRLGLRKGEHYFSVGLSEGAKEVEGLVPEAITKEVFAGNASLVQQLMSGTSSEKKSAKSNLKKLILEQFKREAKPGDEHFKNFYSLVKQINKVIK